MIDTGTPVRMSSSSFGAPVSALNHPIMDKMMRELVATSDPLEGYAAVPTTFTSVVSSGKYNDERHRYWFVACQIAETHFGVSLPDPLQPSDGASVSAAQTTAADKIHECYVEGIEDTMIRFYNLGFSRVSAATHRYALDFSLWMRGYALNVGCSDYGPQFSYTKPWDFVAPFSQEYDEFYRHRKAQEAPPKPIASTITTGSISIAETSSGSNKPNAPSANADQQPRRETKPAPPAISVTRAPSLSAAEPSLGGNKRTVDEFDAMAPVPPFKRPQSGLPQAAQRTLTSMDLLDRNEAHQQSTAKKQPQPSGRPGNPEPAARLCGNRACQSPDHELADCFGPPSEQGGDIEGCPLCNTQEHILDCCPRLPHISRNRLYHTLVTRRANLPAIRTSISILSLASSSNKLLDLAETMPLTKSTVRNIYAEMRPWKHCDRSRLFRDPTLPSDPVAFLEKLDRNWTSVVVATMYDYSHESPENIATRYLTIFRTKWISQLVPHRRIFTQAEVHVEGRGYYPFVDEPRIYERQDKERVKRVLSILRRERAATQRGRP